MILTEKNMTALFHANVSSENALSDAH